MGRPNMTIIVDGVKYDSLKSAYTSLNIGRSFLQKKIKKYGTVLTKDQLKYIKSVHPITINGIHYKSYRDAERSLGLCRNTLSYRIQTNGKLDVKKLERRGRIVVIDGIEYNSLRKAALAIHADKSTISKVIKELGTNVLSRKDIPTHGPVSITIDGVTYNSISEASKTLGIKYELLHQRLRQGYSGNLTDPICTKEDRIKMFGKPIEFDGVKFDSINQASRHFNIAHDTLMWRLKSGWDLDEALYKVPVTSNLTKSKTQLIIERKFNG